MFLSLSWCLDTCSKYSIVAFSIWRVSWICFLLSISEYKYFLVPGLGYFILVSSLVSNILLLQPTQSYMCWLI